MDESGRSSLIERAMCTKCVGFDSTWTGMFPGILRCMRKSRFTCAGPVLVGALVLVVPGAGDSTALSCIDRAVTVESAVEAFRASEAAFVGYKERGLIGFDQYVVLKVYKGDLGGRVLVAKDVYAGGPAGGPARLIRGDNPRGIGDVTRTDQCPLEVRDPGGAPVTDARVANMAYGAPHDPGLTITSAMLTITNHPLRWFSSWPVWIVLAAVLLSILGLREYRARTR